MPIVKRGALMAEGRASRLQSPEGLNLADLRPLGALLGASGPGILSRAEKLRVVGQAMLVLDQIYAHLLSKSAMYLVNPVQELKLLQARIDTLSDPEFHHAMIAAFTRLRDRHTSYLLPRFGSATAILPFRLERCYDGDHIVYVVSAVSSSEGDPHFVRGVEVTHWNGTRIARAVELNGERLAGGNPAAVRAMGERFLTQRPLKYCLPPDEDWVQLTFVADGREREVRFAWSGLVPLGTVDPAQRPGLNLVGQGLDEMLWTANRAQRIRFFAPTFDRERRMAEVQDQMVAEKAPPPPDLSKESSLPNFDFRAVETPSGRFGYVRIWDFRADDANVFLNEFVRIIRLLPQEGLIIDIRDNPGGYIKAGEFCLQTLTPRRITPERFHFRNSPLALDACEHNSLLANWLPSERQAVKTGSPYSLGFPIEDSDDDFNRLGQQYWGPVVLITSALCYSTADMFTAGFRDHQIGKILGIDPNTGAGGANNWSHPVVRLFYPGFRLPPAFQSDLESGKVTPRLRQAFADNGAYLTDKATTVVNAPDAQSNAWKLPDGPLTYLLRRVDWMADDITVYFEGDRSPLQDLPDGVSLGFAVRRSTRVGSASGVPLEDLGITPDEPHRMTRRDVLSANEDLIAHAGQLLAGMPRYALSVEVRPAESGKRAAVISAKNLDRVDLYIDGRPRGTADIQEAPVTVPLPASGGPSVELEVLGYKAGTLVAAKRRTVPPAG
jgi:hypothetical protein